MDPDDDDKIGPDNRKNDDNKPPMPADAPPAAEPSEPSPPEPPLKPPLKLPLSPPIVEVMAPIFGVITA